MAAGTFHPFFPINYIYWSTRLDTLHHARPSWKGDAWVASPLTQDMHPPVSASRQGFTEALTRLCLETVSRIGAS